MKFALLSVVATAGLVFASGSASAQPYGHHHNHGSYYYGHPYGGHLDYHNGHYHYHNGYYRSGPLVPAYPSYGYPSYGYNSGFNFSFGTGRVTPLYNYGGLYSPYGRRW
jgi:hypothetical protein